MDENKIMEEIIENRQQKRKELPQTRDLRRYIKRKDMQPKSVQLQNLHYKVVKYEKRIALLEQKLDSLDKRITDNEEHIQRWIDEEVESEEKE